MSERTAIWIVSFTRPSLLESDPKAFWTAVAALVAV